MSATREEVLEFLNSEGNSNFLRENNLVPSTEITETAVEDFLKTNTNIQAKIYAEANKNFLASKLGVSNPDDSILSQDIVTKSNLDVALKVAVKGYLSHTKYPDLLADKVDYSKVKFEENKISGIEDEIKRLTTSYPDLFKQQLNTPPSIPTPLQNTRVEEIEKELAELKKNGINQISKAKMTKLIEEKSKLIAGGK